jgi:peptidoglycan/LPS O-acetylase OafA/YrhL
MTLVDGLRAVAALVVILPHAWVLFQDVARHSPAIDRVVYVVRVHGTLGVQVFFVLSGFVIAYSMRDVRVTIGYFARFVARRSIRLEPPYWAGLAICCGVLWFGRHVAHDGSVLPTGRQLLANVVYLQQFLRCNDSINHTYWTLCQEVQMYLAFCAAIGLLQAARVPYRTALTVAFVVSLAWPLAVIWPAPWGWLGWSVRGLFLPNAYAFLGGAVAWWTVEGAVARPVALAAAGLTVVVASRHGDTQVWAVAVVATLLVVAGQRGTLRAWLNHWPIQALGQASYGLYLLHNPVISLALMAQSRLGWTTLPGDFALLAGVGAVSVVAASGMHVWIERPCLRLGRRLRAAKREVPLIPG